MQPVGGATALRIDEVGRPAVINLWATWCAPCKAELPMLQDQYERVGRDVVFIGVNIGDDAPSVERFTADAGVSYPQYLDPRGEVSTALAVAAVPATLLVDRDGTFVVHSGAIDRDDLVSWIDRVTAEP